MAVCALYRIATACHTTQGNQTQKSRANPAG